MNEIKKIVPSHIFEKIYEFKDEIEEIRLRKNKYLTIRLSNAMKTIYSVRVCKDDIDYVLNHATDFSIHTYIEQIRHGFLTYYGHRIGISGSCISKNNEIVNFIDISSLNIRFAKKTVPIERSILKSTIHKNTLLISPPNVGKTTLLREIIKYLSGESANISVIDEKKEIENSDELGEFVDFISGVHKEIGVFMMIKTMSPDYIILDEITNNTEIIDKIVNNGVNIVATIHGNGYFDVKNKEIIKYFDNFIEISMCENIRIYNVRESDFVD